MIIFLRAWAPNAQRSVMYIGQMLRLAAESNLIWQAPKLSKVLKAAEGNKRNKTVRGSGNDVLVSQPSDSRADHWRFRCIETKG